MKDIYLILSATNGHMGKLIRSLTDMPYNHISFSFDPHLQDIISFARYYYAAPLYGGFIHESKERYEHTPILLFKIPISQSSYEKIHHLITEMDKHPHDYLYHTINAVLSPFHRSIHIKNAYTCVSFIAMLLHQTEFSFDSVYDIRQIKKKLDPYLVYEGNMDDFMLQSDPSYMKTITFTDSIKLSLIQNYKLFQRFINS